MSENGEIYTAGKKFTLPPALTNSTSGMCMMHAQYIYDERTNGQGDSRSWIRDVMLLLMMVKVIRMFMWQVIRHDNLCNVGQN